MLWQKLCNILYKSNLFCDKLLSDGGKLFLSWNEFIRGYFIAIYDSKYISFVLI